MYFSLKKEVQIQVILIKLIFVNLYNNYLFFNIEYYFAKIELNHIFLFVNYLWHP